jgi:hypothetical protein
MALPPSDGAVQLTVTAPVDDVAITVVGASGIDAGVTDAEEAEGSDVPAELVAVTVKV